MSESSSTDFSITARQECQPLDTVKQVFEWQADESDWSVHVRRLAPRAYYCYEGSNFKCHKKFRKPLKIVNSGAPKTLLCHDMMGGYLDDRFVEGAPYRCQYLFYHWSAIDTFVYFSHHFVTIPPLMWINAAHEHGVKVLGTIITEGADGKEKCDQILSSPDKVLQFVDKLVAICKHYRFDGYLLNVENEIDVTLLPRLIMLVRELKLRTENLGAMIVWYDSVSLVDGKLNWQNELNQHNEAVFNLCDGIYLNYGWTVTNLQNSMANAGCRQYDVYVGVDVFGRGCFGGGGFNTDMAMRVLRSFALSAALFGPGWTYETQADDLNFFAVESKFWSKLWPYLYVHVSCSLPFQTTFNRGIRIDPDACNTATDSVDQHVLSYDLSAQSYQLSMPSCPGVVSTEDRCAVFSDCFSKQSFIVLVQNEHETERHRLLLCDFACSHRRPLRLTISARPVNRTFIPFEVVLVVESDRNFTVLLRVSAAAATTSIEEVGHHSDFTISVSSSEPINATKLINYSSGDREGWISNEFVLDFDGRITEISATVKESILISFLSLNYEKMV